MKGLIAVGGILFGVALAGFGIIQFITQRFLTSLLPFSALPLKALWINITALILLTCGIMLVLRKTIAQASAIVALLFTLFFLFPHLPRLVTHIKDPTVWTVAFETLAIASGAWMISAARIRELKNVQKWMTTVQSLYALNRVAFAISLVVFGVLHFMYQDFIIMLMPAWLPGKMIWAYLVKFGFILTALSLLLNLKIHWSLFLLGTMFLTWVVILHAPRSIAKLNDANE